MKENYHIQYIHNQKKTKHFLLNILIKKLIQKLYNNYKPTKLV